MRPRLMVLTGLLAIALAGCGGGSSSSSSGGSSSGGGASTASGSASGSATSTQSSGGASTSSSAGSSASATGSATAGKKVFASAGCGSCHTLKAAGSSGTVGPNLDDLKPSADIVRTQVINGGGPMPSFKGRLSAKQINDVAAFVAGAAGH